MASNLRLAVLILLILLLVYIAIKHIDTPEHVQPRVVNPERLRFRILRIFDTGIMRREFLRHIINANRFNDTQNVHESAVVAAIARKYARLVELQPDVTDELLPTLAEVAHTEIIDYATKNMPDSLTQVTETLQYMQQSDAKISSLCPNREITELEVLARVHLRVSMSPATADLWDILIKQIVDMREGTGYVCVTGRVSRLINTFTAVDPDEKLAEVELSASQLQLAIINRAHAIVKEQLDADEDLKATYDGSETLPDAIAEKLKASIEEKLRNEYKDKVDTITLSKLIDEAKSAIA